MRAAYASRVTYGSKWSLESHWARWASRPSNATRPRSTWRYHLRFRVRTMSLAAGAGWHALSASLASWEKK